MAGTPAHGSPLVWAGNGLAITEDAAVVMAGVRVRRAIGALRMDVLRVSSEIGTATGFMVGADATLTGRPAVIIGGTALLVGVSIALVIVGDVVCFGPC